MHAQSWSFDLVVERGKVRELARALHMATDDEAGLAPLTFPVVLNHWGFSGSQILEELGYDVKRVLHGQEEYDYPDGPLREGEHLLGTMRLASTEAKEGRRGGMMTVLRFVTDLAAAGDGRVRATITRTLLVREGTP